MKKILEKLTSLGAAWLFAAGVAVCVAVLAVWFGALNQDEGWYLYAAQLVHAGKLPYHDFFYTQGPAMPFVYSVFAPVWGPDSPLHGLLGGRLVTLFFGCLATALAVALVRLVVPLVHRAWAGLAVFALLACNIYHVYFTTIPKTYALGSTFVLAGFLLVARGCGLRPNGRAVPACGLASALHLALGGLSLAFATGTRISLLLILPVIGCTLLVEMRRYKLGFLWFGLGGACGLFLTYGFFALDDASLCTLLAAQSYHAARGGFDPFFALGSVSRLARGYMALGFALFVATALCGKHVRMRTDEDGQDAAQRSLLWMLGLGFAAVFLLQLSAPFPYDDYQVPLMGLLTVLIVAFLARGVSAVRGRACAWIVVLAAGLASFASPLLQEWATFTPDRFWSRKKEMTELAKLRAVADEINHLDPGGKTLLTQDLYLAVEAGRTVPEGLEMGPFSYFPALSNEQAKATHVLNREQMEKLLAAAPCPLVAASGYMFAIGAPSCAEVPFDEQKRLFQILKKSYDLVDTYPQFGQNATTLLILKRKEKESAK